MDTTQNMLSLEPASVEVFQRPDRFVIQSMVRTMPGGPWTNGSSIATVAIDAADEQLGRAIREALRDRRPAPEPALDSGGRKAVAPLWRAGGVKTRRAFMNGTRLCSVEWRQHGDRGWLFQVITAKSYSTGGWLYEPSHDDLTLSATATDTDLGRAARTALARGTARESRSTSRNLER